MGDVAGRAGDPPAPVDRGGRDVGAARGPALSPLAGYRAAGGVNGALATHGRGGIRHVRRPRRARLAARRMVRRLRDAGEDAATEPEPPPPVSEAVVEATTTPTGTAALECPREPPAAHHRQRCGRGRPRGPLRGVAPPARTWLEEDVQGRRLRRRLDDAAHSWETAGRDPSELYRGARLDAAPTTGPRTTGTTSPPSSGRSSTPAGPGATPSVAARRAGASPPRPARGTPWRSRSSPSPPGDGGGQRQPCHRPGAAWPRRASGRGGDRQPRRRPRAQHAAGAEAGRVIAGTDDDPGAAALPEAEEALHRGDVVTYRPACPGLGGAVDWSPAGDTFVTEGPEKSGDDRHP